eukprot:Skav234752  [mRNA]  locus=scaffold14:828563:834442:+ [translate_table: standard]
MAFIGTKVESFHPLIQNSPSTKTLRRHLPKRAGPVSSIQSIESSAASGGRSHQARLSLRLASSAKGFAWSREVNA